MGHLVGVIGEARHGKDTLGAYLVQEEGFVARGFATALKGDAWTSFYHTLWQMWAADRTSTAGKEATSLQAYIDAKPPLVRTFLQDLGVYRRVRDGEDYWVQRLAAWREEVHPARLVITDVRFANEAAWVRQQGGELWRVVRPGVSIESTHVSETEQRGIPVDRTFLNDGTIADLWEKVRNRS